MRVGIWNGAAALLLAAALSGCAAGNLNPVTGKAIYTPVPAAVEAYYGKKAYDEMSAAYGVYKEDAALTAYVDRVGQALAKNVVRKDVHYTFTILDDDEIDAFALPGGYICITRGALNFANSEAELAAILGHEIGHVDAFHFGRGGGHDTTKALLSVLLRHTGNAGDLALAQKLADQSTKAAAYSQQQEFEADALGIHYMALAGYDPQGMVDALRTEDAKMKLDDGKMKGNPIAHDIFALDQSHPDTPEREARAAAEAKNAALAPPNGSPGGSENGSPSASPAGSPTGAGPKTDRDAYLAAIDGMTFGADPADGKVDGHRLVNAALGFSFDVPADFDLWPSHGGAFGAGSKAVLVFETTDKYAGQSMAAYVQSSMMPKMQVEDVRPLEIDGYRAATGLVSKGPFAIRLAAIHDSGNHLYRLLYVAPRRVFSDLDAGFLDSLKSFRPLEGAEATPHPPLHLHIITVAGGDTVKNLSDRMALKEQKLEWFRVLNGLGAEDEVKPGDKVKLVE
jgi:predicted Zn-dependent protease